MAEFDLIARIRARTRVDDSVRLGIGDDAAVLAPTPGFELVVTTDALLPGRHFTGTWTPAEIGWLAAQVNLSDLAAMGAWPRWALLALSLPDPDTVWLDGFLDGFFEGADAVSLNLVGGNLARGPLNIGVQLIGELPAGEVLTRSGAHIGDRIIVSGTPGDAAAALALGESADEALRQRLRRPRARLEAGLALRGLAHAAIDISDGLLADLAHLLQPGQGALLDFDLLPGSTALHKAFPEPLERWRFQAAGGSDYELLAVVPPSTDLVRLSAQAGVAFTAMGEITDSGQIECQSSQAEVPADLSFGWDHFADD